MSVAEATEEGISGYQFAERVMAHLEPETVEPQRFDEGPAEEVVEDGVTDAVTPEAAVESGEQPRNPDGTFASKEKPEDEQPAGTAEQPAEPAEETETETLLAGKYKTQEELERAYAEAERRLGEMRNEVGTSRQEMQALQASVEQRLAELTAAVNRPPVIPVTHAMIEEDPAAAAAQALSNGDYETLVASVEAWKDEEPFEAAVFWANVQNEYRMDQMRRTMADLTPPAQAPAPAAATPSVDDEVNAEVAKVLQRKPDLEQFMPQIGAIARERPYLRAALETGSPQDRAAALEDLYDLAKSRHVAVTSEQAQQEAALEAAQRARQARSEATVISASRSSAAEGATTDGVTAFRQAFRQHTGLPDLEVE